MLRTLRDVNDSKQTESELKLVFVKSAYILSRRIYVCLIMSDPTSTPVSPTKEKSHEIKAINKETVHRICSGQVVLNLATAIKELVENSLDAGATVVEIRLREYGSEFVEVSDNGSGVREENFEGLTLKHHTSKLQEFSDLVDVGTFGFRGEALSSLCALSEMTVITRHASCVTGTKLVYDSDGHIKSKTPCARQIGTTVSLANIFSTLPVRQKEFLRNLKREFVKMTHLLYGYCLIASHAKISCVNQTKKGSRTVVVTTQGSGSVKDNIACIFGSKQVVGLLELKQETPPKEHLEELGVTKDISNMFQLEGCISSCAHGQGRSSADRQFYYINSRPCEPTKVSKVVNEVYHQFNVHQFPFVFLNITTDRSGVDVNVTPDKRQIFLENENLLLAFIKATLLKLYETIPSTFQMENFIPSLRKSVMQEAVVATPQSPTTSNISNGCKKGGFSALLQSFSHGSPKSPSKESRFTNGHLNVEPLGRGTKRVLQVENDRDGKRQMSLASFIRKNASTNSEDCLLSVSSLKKDEHERDDVVEDGVKFQDDSLINTDSAAAQGAEDSLIENESKDATYSVDTENLNFDSAQPVKTRFEAGLTSSIFNSGFSYRRSELPVDDGEISVETVKATGIESTVEGSMTDLTDVESRTESTKVDNGMERSEILVRNESEISREEAKEAWFGRNEIIVCDEDDGRIGHGRRAVRLQVDMKEISSRLLRRRDRLKRKQNDKSKPIVKFYADIDPNSNMNAEKELSREISKDMFAKMAIVGQFNLGFIVTHLGKDLFIVDQHATDEKYNFETLERTTVIQNQKLVIPQTLELTPVNEGLLLDNIEIFRKNGFDFKFDENGPPTRRVQLTAKPYSQNWEFGREDIDELLFMLSDAPHTMCRPSRVRAMFASRACRKSVMIGTALSKADMRRLIDHMGEIEHPWNCPHGRPTLRHLINLEMIQKK